ncbi:hypothetical protein JCM24511_07195 [Saitozyma sp. JCM 24511]|nr:hypothetical protein JCM24511_07195 [Saitozyma sp. JCM 24511]
MSQSSNNHAPLSAFVSFPSPYTQTLLVQALVSTLPAISLSLIPPPEDDPPPLQWADYDLLSFEKPHSNQTEYLTSSYVYRKALIRKHQLHLTITEYLAKCEHRGIRSVLAEGGVPKGWVIEIQFADELEEALMDDLWELAKVLRENEERTPEERQWFILKPGFADRAQGIRMFSTEDELQQIFLDFEPPSSDEEEEEEEEEVEQEVRPTRRDSLTHSGPGRPGRGVEDDINDMAAKAAGLEVEDEGSDEGHIGTGVMISQLRHFVIQEYMYRPVLFDIHQGVRELHGGLAGHKFHLRAYVLLTGDYTVHVSRVMLALFSGSPYVHPTELHTHGNDPDIDLRPHLTNTCLQTDAYGAPMPSEELVKLFWELEGLDALHLSAGTGQHYESRGQVGKEWLEGTFERVGEVVAESVKAGVECGSFGLQLVPNAFEMFGVDLLCSFPDEPAITSVSSSGSLPLPKVTLLEYNASPDFHQSGERLKKELLGMFKGVVRISIAPFFHINLDEEDEGGINDGEQVPGALTSGERPDAGTNTNAGEEWDVGTEKWGWRLVGQGQIRGPGPS